MADPLWLQDAIRNGLVVNETRVAPLAEGAARPLPPAIESAISEAAFQQMVIDFARVQGWRVAHFRKVRVKRKGGDTYWETPVTADGKGFLDLELVRKTRLIKAELKVGSNVMTPEQADWSAAYKLVPGIEVYLWWPRDWSFIQEVLR